ncbi:uncharacterized protein UTRI_05082_B [Ustilago trichophora]|uniref:Endosomal/vacuolar adapter protein YPT35 n=1 Tax=Ustilago trichophora TaxID=86804 RepID=A0A5C3EGZ3_9BASI|nr:uncharacterized protein UTRI_05082_B [Ustilago trichophora]
MDAELTKELREATDQLLDLGPSHPSAFPSSPHLQRPRQPAPTKPANVSTSKLPTFSSGSKLEILHSPTDVRPWHWPTPSTAGTVENKVEDSPSIVAVKGEEQPIKIELGTSVIDDADDHLPAKGLNSRIESVKAATAKTYNVTPSKLNGDHIGEVEGQLRAASPSKLRVRTPINDIYINQYGERVVQGKVVGRILGGRPRPASRNEDAAHPSSSTDVDRHATPSLASSSSPPQSASVQASTSNATATATATSPPAFFLESFPDAFTPRTITPSSPPTKKKERRPSRGGPPSILKAPRAAVGALTLAHSDNVDEPVPVLGRDISFHTASDFGSPSSSSSNQLSPRPHNARLASSSSSRRHVDEDIGSALKGLQLQNVGTEDGTSRLLSPTEGGSTTDSLRAKIDLPSLRRPTPTIELSQAKADTVVLHGNRRQARASGVVQPQDEASSSRGGSMYGSPAVSPPIDSKAMATTRGDAKVTEDLGADNPAPTHSRYGSASEPSSPLVSPRRSQFTYDNAVAAATTADTSHDEPDSSDKASLESAPSSLISLPVSTLTSSSRTPSHTSLERRRSGSSTTASRRRSSTRYTSSSSHSDVFAREVRIRGWSEVGSQARGWVVFELRILTKQGTPIIAHKRFSSFVKLRETLRKECKDQAKWLPQLPTKAAGLLSKYDANYLEKRRRALQRWLESVMLDRVWGASEGLREWVLASD